MAQERLVLSDSSPLIALAAAGGFELLRELFSKISITTEVRAEVFAGGTRVGIPELRRALRAGWMRSLRGTPVLPAFPSLDAGEASVLRAAVHLKSDILVILDDLPARRVAEEHGIAYTGTLGLLVVARRRGLIAVLKPYLARLFEHGFHCSPELARRLLKEVGET